MNRINNALLLIAFSALPVQEIAFAIPHRLEFPFCVVVFCFLVRVCFYALSSSTGQMRASEKVSENCQETAKVEPVDVMQAVADELAHQGTFTVEDLKHVAAVKGISLAPLQYANILKRYKKSGEVVSPNPASKGRKIGVFTN